ATYAAGTMFKKPIIHGFLSGAIFSKIFGMDFPGEGTIYLSQSMQFRRPMYVGETYTARVEVTAIDREKHRCTMSAKVLDARGKETIVGEAELMNAGRV
ncbi:MAG: MaoC family dehydratase, partial [Lewinella sp.]|nr:MaoC family dehydratase [Lewinella sp.]